MSRPFDRSRQYTLMFCTGSSFTPRSYLALIIDVPFDYINLFIIDRDRFFSAELANPRAPGIAPPSWSTARTTLRIASPANIFFSQGINSSVGLSFPTF